MKKQLTKEQKRILREFDRMDEITEIILSKIANENWTVMKAIQAAILYGKYEFSNYESENYETT